MPALHHTHPEAEERAPVNQAQVYAANYDADIIARVQRLDDRRKALGLSDGRWCEGAKYEQTSWSRLRGGTYKGALAKVCAEFERHADALESLASNLNLRRPSKTFTFHSWPAYEAAAMALQQAKINAENHVEDRCGETKNVVYVVLPHGWGKDEIAGKLLRTYGGTRIFARHGWNNSDYAAMTSIAGQLGVRRPKKSSTKSGDDHERDFRSAAEAETAILEHLKDNPRPLYFLEVEMTGEALQNLWKELSNETRCVITIFCLPEFFERHKRRLGVYGEQLRARAEFIVQADKVPSDWVEAVLVEKFGKVEGVKRLAQHLAASATQIGGLRCVQDVTTSLLHDPDHAKTPTLAAVQDHVAMWRSMRHLTPQRVA